MPFGLRNAAQTFQRFIDQVLQGLHCSYAYIDDVLIASATPEEHRRHLREVLRRFQEHGVIVNPVTRWTATEFDLYRREFKHSNRFHNQGRVVSYGSSWGW